MPARKPSYTWRCGVASGRGSRARAAGAGREEARASPAGGLGGQVGFVGGGQRYVIRRAYHSAPAPPTILSRRGGHAGPLLRPPGGGGPAAIAVTLVDGL